MDMDKLVVLCPHEAVSLEPFPLVDGGDGEAFRLAEDTIEEMVVCLAAIEAAWAAGEFGRLKSLLGTVISLARTAGLPDVAHVAGDAETLLSGLDEVALAAVVARLVRVGETSLATLLEISYRQI